MSKLAELFRGAASPAGYVAAYCARLTEVIESLDPTRTAEIIAALERVAEEDKTLFIIANGGSAATASHWVNDLCPNTYVEGKKPYRVMCLTDNVASVTAIANDASYDDIFVFQLRANMRPGDTVLAMSVSGNSENVIRGVDYANAHGAFTIGLSGFDGGRLASRAKLSLHFPTSNDEYGPVEDMFTILCHVVVGYISMKRGRMLSH